MRRLLSSVAALAAVLLAPSIALAASAPVLTAPANTRFLPSMTWTDVQVLPLGLMTYRVFRADGNCATAGGGAQVSADLPATTLAFTQPGALADGVYCYYVTADDGLFPPEPSNRVTVNYDTILPVVTGVTETGADGCTAGVPFTITGAAVTDASPVTLTADGIPVPPDYLVPGAPWDLLSPVVVATDAAGNVSLPFLAPPGHINDPTGPGPVSLEITTDPAAQKATLSWDAVGNDGAPVTYRLRTKGPQGPGTLNNVFSSVSFFNLQVDATYEYTLDAVDACNRVTSSVRLVRLNDTAPPSAPIVAGPALNPTTHAMALSWVASTDNIQVDHYVVLRNGVPLGTTDATVFTDLVVPQRTQLNYVVRAVDTNGNATDSAPAPIMTPDWTAPTAPVLTLNVQGTTATLRWSPAADNIGVVGYDVLRDNKQVASMTAAVRTYKDIGVPKGVHTWNVRARDGATLSALSAPLTARIVRPTARASVLSLRKVGGGSGAARYSLKARARLLVDLRVVGTVTKAKLRLYVNSGRGRITVWRGTPGTSAPKLRLGSALARRGFVTIRLSRTMHAGRIRLVLIPGGQVVIAGKGAHKPKVTMG